MSPSQNDKVNKMEKFEEIRRSQQSDKSGKSANSGASGAQSDDWSDDNLQPNNYNFEQIFDNQALSKEEEELFNQLKAQEENHDVRGFDDDNQIDSSPEESKIGRSG